MGSYSEMKGIRKKQHPIQVWKTEIGIDNFFPNMQKTSGIKIGKRGRVRDEKDSQRKSPIWEIRKSVPSHIISYRTRSNVFEITCVSSHMSRRTSLGIPGSCESERHSRQCFRDILGLIRVIKPIPTTQRRRPSDTQCQQLMNIIFMKASSNNIQYLLFNRSLSVSASLL